MLDLSLTSFKAKQAVAFGKLRHAKQFWLLIGLILFVAGLLTYLLLTFNNPVPMSSPAYTRIVSRRMNAVISMALASICQGMATVVFQSVTANRLITPSLLGFEAVYGLIQTAGVFVLGIPVLMSIDPVAMFGIEIIVMVGLCLLLYTTLLNGFVKNTHWMLLVGIIAGSVLRSLSSFMRKWLDPADYDILQARLMLSVNHADQNLIPIAFVFVLIAAILLWRLSPQLNVLALGKDMATMLGLNYRKFLIGILSLVAILMSVSTALVGPITFLGFLAAALTYQAVATHDHRYLLPVVSVMAYVILSGSYFILYHVVDTQGSVAIIIEFIGGLSFLFVLIRRKKL
ncbi:iron chelate uptake ABC transporter family permease subunit [Facklamia sp. 7083-14-GEN3]|uniref:iron chelate uptake ABC transporter family permease subunit n=1 Tax=Facklamia sp. 7083-14-GEN3 TaxID=2973478 RepID=UPI00215C86DE|nr:iron chelate uptake ABC transporter family permease subunit [Facklamia sp. 7083-14-GEN3]MCR8968429.1 iron chelate uptake ABC transporter family permease subunit [Facklamia sp. 7083-14-GEN3]